MFGQKPIEYAERLMAEFEKRGIKTCIRKEKDENGNEYYGVRIIEDPHFGPVLTLWFNMLQVSSSEQGSLSDYVDEALEKAAGMESPLKKAYFAIGINGYEETKKNLMPFLVNGEAFKTFLKGVPHRDYLDLAVTYCNFDKKNGQCVTITNELADKFGVTEEQLYDDAIKKVIPEGPVYRFRMFPDKPGATKEETDEREKKDPCPMYILSNSEFIGGANAILCPAFLKQVSGKLGGDYYVFMGIDAFLIAIPKRKNSISLDNMKEKVTEIYERYKNLDSDLSDAVYYYNTSSGKLEKV